MIRLASKEILYHGTATGQNDEILTRILKEGLNPNPKRRVFTDEGDKRDLATLGGVYLSARPEDVSKFAMLAQKQFGGDRMAVIVRFETRTPQTTLDEDELFPIGPTVVYLDTYGRAAWNVVELRGPMLLNLLEADKLDWDSVAKHFLVDKIERTWGTIDPRARERMVAPLAEVMKWQAFYREALHSEQEGYWYERQYREQIGVSSVEALQNLRRAVKAAMAALRRFATPPQEEEDDWRVDWQRKNQKIQTETPITYRGANRILAVLRWREGQDETGTPDYYMVGEVVYATTEGLQEAQRLIEGALRSLKSQHMLWTGPQGQTLYDVRAEPAERAASLYRFRGAVYREAYIRRDLGWLKHHLEQSDAEKGRELALLLPVMFLHYVDTNVPTDENLAARGAPFSYDDIAAEDEAVIVEHLRRAREELLAGFYAEVEGEPGSFLETFYMREIVGKLRGHTPSFLFFGDPELVKNQWLIHFTSTPYEIQREGFTVGAKDLSRLGLTTRISRSDKTGGYNFAYTADDYVEYAKRDHGVYVDWKYGAHAVMFRASGLRMWHKTDQEPQTIFWGADARDVVVLRDLRKVSKGDGWCAVDCDGTELVFCAAGLERVVDWVMANFEQYRKVLTCS